MADFVNEFYMNNVLKRCCDRITYYVYSNLADFVNNFGNWWSRCRVWCLCCFLRNGCCFGLP